MKKDSKHAIKKGKEHHIEQKIPEKKPVHTVSKNKTIKHKMHPKDVKDKALPEESFKYLDTIIKEKEEKKHKEHKTPIIVHEETIIASKNDDVIESPPVQIENKEVITDDLEGDEAVLKAPVIVETKEVDDSKNRIEALLFACGKYMDEQTISELCSIDKRKLRKILEDLKKDYESRNSALMIFQEDTSWKINVREKYISLVRKIVSDTELSKSIMETLAVIAWKSPIYQSEVVKIRGNKCYDHIEELENAGFVTKEKKGRSYVLKTTDKFFNYFDIDHGNLKGIFDTVKIPEIKASQTTLNEVEPTTIPANTQNKIDAINVMKRTETDEEKNSHKQFLETMDQKLTQINEKNTQLESEIPRPMHEHGDIQPPLGDNTEPNVEIQEPTIVVPIQENQTITTDTQVNAPVDQTLSSQVQEKPKAKSLTKKQLEKKFKDELLRVRDKMEKK